MFHNGSLSNYEDVVVYLFLTCWIRLISFNPQVTFIKTAKLKIMNFQKEKILNIFSFLLRWRIYRVWRCESHMSLCEWRITWNYIYSPFNHIKRSWIDPGFSLVFGLIFKQLNVWIQTERCFIYKYKWLNKKPCLLN